MAENDPPLEVASRPSSAVSERDRDRTLEAMHALEEAAGRPIAKDPKDWTEVILQSLQRLEAAFADQQASYDDPLGLMREVARDHPRLPTLPAAAQRTEVRSGRAGVAELAGVEPRFFAFPYGDASRRSGRIVREAGFEQAFGSRWALPVTTVSPRFETPRIAAVEEDAPSLVRRLDRVLADVG